jgi:hypothetical protein
MRKEMVDIGKEENKKGGGGIDKNKGVKDGRKTRRERQNVIFGGYFSPYV